MATTTAALEFYITAKDADILSSIKGIESKFNSGVKSMADAAREQASKITQSLSSIEGFAKLKKQVGELEADWRSATEEVARLAGEMAEVEKPARAMVREFEKAKKTAKGLKSEFDGQSQALQGLRKSLYDAGIGTIGLVDSQAKLNRELDEATKELEAQTQAAKAFSVIGVRSLRDVEQEVDKLNRAYDLLKASGKASSKDLVRAHAAVEAQTRSLRGQTDKLSTSSAGLASSVKTLVSAYLGFQTVQAGFGFIKDSILAFAEFDDIMRQVGATSQSTGKDLESLTTLARTMGASTSFSAVQAAEGLRALSLAGLSVSNQLVALPRVLELAAAGSVDLEKAAAIATKTLTQYGLKTTELVNVNNILVTAFTNSATNLEDLGLALQHAGSVASSAGATFEDTATVLAIMAKSGVAGEKAGTALKAAYAKLIDPTAEAAIVIKNLGIKTKDSSLQLLPMVEILKNLREAGANTKEIFQIFGLETAPALAGAVKLAAVEFDGLIGKFKDMGDVAAKVAKEMEAGLGGSLRTLSSAWKEVGIAVGEAIDKHSSLDIKELTQAINENKDSIVRLAVGAVNLAAVLAKGAIAVGEFLNEWRHVIVALGAVAVSVKVVSAGYAAFMALNIGGFLASAAAATIGLSTAMGPGGLVGTLALAKTGMVSLTATSLIPFLSSGAAGATALSVALGPVGLTIAAVAAAVGVLAVKYGELKDAEDMARENAKKLVELDVERTQRLKDMSEELGIAIPNMQAFYKLVQDGKVVFDDAIQGWKVLAETATEAAQRQREESAKTTALIVEQLGKEKAAKRSLAELEKQLSEETRRLQQEILQEKIKTAEESVKVAEKAVEQSLDAEKRLQSEIFTIEESKRRAKLTTAEKIHELTRRNMTEAEKESDSAANALTKLDEARKLLSKTNLSEKDAKWAEKLAKEAQSAYANLKNTDAAIAGVSKSGAILEKVYQAQGKTATAAFASQKVQTTGLNAQLDVARGKVVALQKELAAIPQKTTKTIELQAEISQATASLNAIQQQLAALQDKTVTVTVNTVEGHAAGGMISGFSTRFIQGGRLPGYGGGDTRPTMLEPGEIVVTKSRAAMFQNLLLAINSAPLSTVRKMLPQIPGFKDGGIVNQKISLPSFTVPAPVIAMAGGGVVPQTKSPDVVQLNLSINNRPAATVTSPRENINQLVEVLKDIQRGIR